MSNEITKETIKQALDYIEKKSGTLNQDGIIHAALLCVHYRDYSKYQGEEFVPSTQYHSLHSKGLTEQTEKLLHKDNLLHVLGLKEGDFTPSNAKKTVQTLVDNIKEKEDSKNFSCNKSLSQSKSEKPDVEIKDGKTIINGMISLGSGVKPQNVSIGGKKLTELAAEKAFNYVMEQEPKGAEPKPAHIIKAALLLSLQQHACYKQKDRNYTKNPPSEFFNQAFSDIEKMLNKDWLEGAVNSLKGMKIAKKKDTSKENIQQIEQLAEAIKPTLTGKDVGLDYKEKSPEQSKGGRGGL